MDDMADRHGKAFHVLYKSKEVMNFTVDVCEPDTYLNHAWKECICSGTAYLYITLEKNYAEQIIAQLEDVHKNLGFKRVYFDKINAYEPNLTTYTEDDKGNCSYNWEQVDKIYDRILNIGVKPFVMISAMPKALASDPANLNFDGGNSSAPKDYRCWKEYCKNFVLHLIGRYGDEEVSSWYFQIFNEPDIGNIYWSGTHEEFYKTYDYAATGIKEVDERIRVGPGGFAFVNGHLLCAFIDHVTSVNYDPEGNVKGAPIDFINGHGYPLPFKRSFKDDFDKMNRYMINHFGPNHNKDLIISEWNSDAAMRPLSTHDGAYNAAFLVRQIVECSETFFSDPDKTRFFSFWTHSDIFDELGEIESEFPGLYGLITRNGIRKPNYNAFRMLNNLGVSRIKIFGGNDNVNGIATYNRDKITIIIFNCVYDILRTEGDESLERSINLEVKNIPWPKVQIEHYRIDNEHSNAYTVWKGMGSPRDCSDEQLEFLKSKMNLELLEDPYTAMTYNGVFSSWFNLPMPSVSMLVITPVEKEFVVLDENKCINMKDFLMGV